MKKEDVFTKLISGTYKGFVPNALRALLFKGSQLYGTIVERRNQAFEEQRRETFSVPIPVISVGNITVGGTGKTPCTLYLCQYFRKKDMFPVIIMRGYKAKDNSKSQIVSDGQTIFMTPKECGDEAYLLAQSLPTCGVVIGRNRKESAQIAMEQLGAQVLIMDDGFQRRTMERDLNILLIDSTQPFGYGYVLPRGLLREPLPSIKRADLIYLTKANQVDDRQKKEIYDTLATYGTSIPIGETIHAPQNICSLEQWMNRANQGHSYISKGTDHSEVGEGARGGTRPYFAVSAIGNPQSFIKTLEEGGYTVGSSEFYGDHYDYKPSDIPHMIERAKSNHCQAIVMTEKDAVKLGPLIVEANIEDMPFYVLPVRFTINKNKEALDEALESLIKNR